MANHHFSPEDSEKIFLSKRHLEAIYDALEDPVFVVTPSLNLARINKSYLENAGGKTYQEVLEKDCYRILDKRSEPCQDCPLMQGRTNAFKREIRIGEDQNRIYQAYFYPLRDESGGISGYVEFLHDITEEEKLKESLSHAKENLEKYAYEMNEELEIARKVHASILPAEIPRLPELDIAVYYNSANKLGGDLYDFIKIDNSNLGILLADVAGHGIPAAFVAAMAKMSFYQNTANEVSSAKTLQMVNNDLVKNLTSDIFVTCFYGIYNQNTNLFTYTSGGHPPMILLRAGGELVPLKTGGFILGTFADGKYEQNQVKIGKGDKIILFTDGFNESRNPQNKKISMSLIEKYLVERRGRSARELLDELVKLIRDFMQGRPQDDDVTLAVLDFTMEDKVKYFGLEKYIQSTDIFITSVRHPLEFEENIGSILREMDRNRFMDNSIRMSKYAIFEALNVFYMSMGEKSGGGRIFIASGINKDAAEIVIMSENQEQRLDPDSPLFKRSFAKISQMVQNLELMDGNRKLRFKMGRGEAL